MGELRKGDSMKVFISWSGTRSKIVAQSLHEWLPTVLQAVEPWMSAQDIEAGVVWSKEVTDELETADFGIICVTPENQDAPWIHFESGALAKAIERRHVCPYMFGFTPSELRSGPLSHFQSKQASEHQTWELIQTLNRCLDNPLANERLKKSFDHWWPELEQSLKCIPDLEIPDSPILHLDDILKPRNHIPPFELDYKDAQSFDILGMSLLAISTQHFEFMLEKARTGCHIRFLILNPNNKNLIEMTCGLVGSLTPEGHQREIITSLTTFKSNPDFLDSEHVQIRLYDHPPTHGLLIADGDWPSGKMRIEMYMRKKRPTMTPGITIRKEYNSELFSMFLNEFNEVWEAATPYKG